MFNIIGIHQQCLIYIYIYIYMCVRYEQLICSLTNLRPSAAPSEPFWSRARWADSHRQKAIPVGIPWRNWPVSLDEFRSAGNWYSHAVCPQSWNEARCPGGVQIKSWRFTTGYKKPLQFDEVSISTLWTLEKPEYQSKPSKLHHSRHRHRAENQNLKCGFRQGRQLESQIGSGHHEEDLGTRKSWKGGPVGQHHRIPILQFQGSIWCLRYQENGQTSNAGCCAKPGVLSANSWLHLLHGLIQQCTCADNPISVMIELWAFSTSVINPSHGTPL